MWLLGTNYQNNLVLASAYFLLSLMIVSMSHAYYNLAGLNVLVTKTVPGFSKKVGYIDVEFNPRRNKRYAIECFFSKGHKEAMSLLDKSEICRLSVPLQFRGWQDPGRLTLVTYYPLGLIKAWSHLHLDSLVLSYPKPSVNENLPQQSSTEADNDTNESIKTLGTSEFSGVRDYRQGDSPKRIAWKHYSRTEKLVVKEFEDHKASSLWLSWFQFPNLGQEEKLSHLCYCVTQLSDNDVIGLALPGVTIEPGSGPAHRQQLLAALALYE